MIRRVGSLLGLLGLLGCLGIEKPGGRSGQHFYRGKRLLLAGQPHEAATDFLAARRLRHRGWELLHLHAQALEESGNFEDALALRRKILAGEPRDYESRLAVVRLHYALSDWNDATRRRLLAETERDLEAADKAGLVGTPFLLHLLDVHDLLSGQFPAALGPKLLQHCLGHRSPLIRRRMAMRQYWDGHLEPDRVRAIRSLDDLVRTAPPGEAADRGFDRLIGHLLPPGPVYNPKAEEYSDLWLERDPENFRAYLIIARVYLERKMGPSRALKLAKEAYLLLQTEKWQNYFKWRVADHEIEDLDRAKGASCALMAWAQTELTHFSAAERICRLAVNFHPRSVRAAWVWARVRRARNQPEKAIDACLEGLSLGHLEEMEALLHRLLRQDARPLNELRREQLKLRGLPPIVFENVTQPVGLSAPDDQAPARHAAWGDFDRDGWEDLILDGRFIWKNDRGRFQNVTARSKLGKRQVHAAAIADFDNDGKLDAYTFGSDDRLLRGNGDGSFTDVTQAVGLGCRFHAAAAAWADYDRDGFVDLYLANAERPGYPHGRNDRDFLYRNRNGTFTDVTQTAGVVPWARRHGRSVAWGDYDDDGRPDLYLANHHGGENYLWRNRGGRFHDAATTTGTRGRRHPGGSYGHSLGAAWGDFNNDGRLDLFVTNLARPGDLPHRDKSLLYQQHRNETGQVTFQDVRRKARIFYAESHAAVAWGDYDNDGWLDLALTQADPGQPTQLYRNQGDGTFTDVTYLAGVRVFDAGSVAWCDYDNDGDLDLFVGRAGLFRNPGQGNRWIQFRLMGSVSNRAAIGARVTLRYADRLQVRQISGGGSPSQSSLIVHFGLGRHDGPVDVEIRWPNGRKQLLPRLPGNQRHPVTEPGE